MNVEKRRHLGGIAAGNNHYARPAVAHYLLQEESDARIRIGLITLGMKGRQSSIVIEQQGGLGSFGKLAQKWLELGL